MKCQATISTDEARAAGHNVGNLGKGFDATDIAAHWCENEAIGAIPLNFGQRLVNVEVCAEHRDEYLRMLEAV